MPTYQNLGSVRAYGFGDDESVATPDETSGKVVDESGSHVHGDGVQSSHSSLVVGIGPNDDIPEEESDVYVAPSCFAL